MEAGENVEPSTFSPFAHKAILVILGQKIIPLPVVLTVGLESSMEFAKTLLPFHQEHVRIMSLEANFTSYLSVEMYLKHKN